jgi:hypothetical protein
VFVVLSEGQAQKKLDAMHLYKSQLREPGHPRNTRSLQALMEYRGACVGAQHAEGYYCHKFCIGV